jgi:tryptophan halogenase
MDFITDLEMYPPSSWQYVLYGMEFQTQMYANPVSHPRFEEARREFHTIAQMAERALGNLPDHRMLVEHLCNKNAMATPHSKVA